MNTYMTLNSHHKKEVETDFNVFMNILDITEMNLGFFLQFEVKLIIA